tara:strand:- start:1658 stop:2908 length:1251 start_codon:yes stop_codon:yes gene_type:complete
MAYYKFENNDLLYNQVKTYPVSNFVISEKRVYYNNRSQEAGAYTASVPCVPPGYVSLYEMNVDRSGSSVSPNLIYPFVVKNGSLTSFRTITTGNFNTDFSFDPAAGNNVISGKYPLSASIRSDFYIAGHNDITASALQNSLNNYRVLSPWFTYSGSYAGAKSTVIQFNPSVDNNTLPLRIISIPSIFYGSSIKKGSVSLKYYISGSLIGELNDAKKNGELRQAQDITNVLGTTSTSGSVAGVVMYNEGFILLTGSWDITDGDQVYTPGATARPGKWYDFATTGSKFVDKVTSQVPYATFEMTFQGVNYIPTLTMFANAPKGEINYSTNPTALSYNGVKNASFHSGSFAYMEANDIKIKNIVSASYDTPEPSFEKTVFIEKIGIYDENKNLIAVAKMAKPIRKRDTDDLTFKLKLDF